MKSKKKRKKNKLGSSENMGSGKRKRVLGKFIRNFVFYLNSINFLSLDFLP